MEFPFNRGHHHTHHHKRDDEDNPPPYPPPGTTSTFHTNPYSQPPPPQQPQPPFYGGVAQPQPPQYEPVPQVFHSSHVTQGHVSHDFNNYTNAPPPPPPSSHHHEPDHHSSFNYGHPSAPGYNPPPPGANANVHHLSHETRRPDFASSAAPGYNPPPPGANANVHHVSHESHLPTGHQNYSSSSVSVHHVSHHGGGGGASAEISNKPTVKVVTKADPNYSLSIRHGKVILARSDPRDQNQHWYKDEKYSTRVKDSEGCPAFSLVNKVTGEAIKHSIGATHPVQLIPYNPNSLDESVLWTESRDLGDGHRAIRMVNNIHLNVDAYHGDKKSGGVHDGTTIVLLDWNKGDNQRWKIIPY